MRHVGLFTLMFFFCFPAYAGFENSESSARIRALGGAFVGLADDVWAISLNPAGGASLDIPAISTSYLPQRFGLTELRELMFAAIYPAKIGTFGVAGRQFGFELYREFTASVSYARSAAILNFGVTINYHSVKIQNYGSAGTFSGDVGLLLPVLKVLNVGIAAKNINAANVGESEERLPQIFIAGLSYSPISTLTLVFDYQKELRFPISIRSGIEYWVIPEIAVRGGFSDEPASYSAGLGVRYSFVELAYAFSTHSVLGLTHQGTVTLRWE